MKRYNHHIILLLLPLSVTICTLASQRVDLSIAVSLAAPAFQSVTKQIIAARSKINKASKRVGYHFDPYIQPEGLHITIEGINDVKHADIPKYKECIGKLINTTKRFDIANDIKSSRFDILPHKRPWGVLRFDTPKKHALRKLAKQIKHRLREMNLKTGIYPEYIGHISLGSFLKKDALVPTANNISWAPPVAISTGNQPMMVDQIEIAVRNHVKNEHTGETKIKKTSTKFMLKK